MSRDLEDEDGIDGPAEKAWQRAMREDAAAFERFAKAEAAASRRFVDRFAMEDFTGPGGAVYTRRYACGCGFSCRAPREIWTHAKGCGGDR